METRKTMDKVNEIINQILAENGEHFLDYDQNEAWIYQEKYDFIQEYAVANDLLYTAVSLPVARSLHTGMHRGTTTVKGLEYQTPYINHCLSVCKMLIDLHVPLENEELDTILASALCHDLISKVLMRNSGTELMSVYHLPKDVYDTVLLLSARKYYAPMDQQSFFDRVKANRKALLVRLADRGNIVEDLHHISVYKTHEYIHETRTFYLPMCIYAMEHYPELGGAVNILQEKMRTLIEVSEILGGRYEKNETELTKKILALEEENARIRIVLNDYSKNAK